MKPSSEPTPDTRVMDALRARAAGRLALDFSEYMDVALYDPKVGYYRRDRRRIGYGPGTDFLTATASAPLFGRLVLEACTEILHPEPLGLFEFVEIGAERGAGVLRDLPHPFRSVRLVGIGEPLEFSGPSILFSNELFDAQPFRRFRYRGGAWRELGVEVSGPTPVEVELSAPAPFPADWPASAPEGYTIDAPLSAAALARSLARQPWTGLFLAFDYGKSWEELTTATPQGTSRAYKEHTQGNDLLANAGEQDLTCHVCWDWLSQALKDEGFASPKVETQEAFFVHHAGAFIAGFAAAEAGRLSRDKLSLLQLIHPANMGQKFQALWALRNVHDRLEKIGK
jgi:SAM-dependent MidA family methyltransferase